MATQKQYATAILSADNWRKNYDDANADKNYWFARFEQIEKSRPMLFFVGIMIGVTGVLLASNCFLIWQN